MESQLTLVDDCDPISSDNMTLVFDRDDMMDTTLRLHDSHLPSYSVDTHGNTTKICAGRYVLATVTRRTLWPDLIAFPGLRPMKLKRWLKAPLVGSFPLSFRPCGLRLQWQENLAQQLVLCEAGRPGGPLAWLSTGGRAVRSGDHSMGVAQLVMKPEVVEIRDMIVLSCLLAEQKRRELIAKDCLGKTLLDVMVLGF